MRQWLCLSWLLMNIASPVLAEPALSKAEITPEAASGFVATPTVTAERWLAATNHPDATAAAADVLRRGGSAVDAAIAAQMMLGLVEPQSSGIGGGAFLLYWDAERKKLLHYDGRETAPAAVSTSHFLVDHQPMDFLDAVVGGHAVGVPGVLRMLELAHARHGQLPWAELFRAAIERAESGFPISPRLHTLLEKMPRLTELPAMREYFFDGNGQPKPVGTVLRNPDYGDTLRRVATNGAHVFYEGEIARDIVAAVNGTARPGAITLADLANYRAIERAPVCGQYRQFRVCGAPPPSSGGTTVLAILGMLAQFDPALLEPGSASFYHLFAEASRLAFADRNTYVADPDFVAVPTTGLVDNSYLLSRAALIKRTERRKEVDPGRPPLQAGQSSAYRHRQAASPELTSTSQITIVDAAGNAVTMTTSIETAFGSRLLVRGFLLNNQLTDFSFVPAIGGDEAVANRIEPGKRPRSSMAPTVVFDNGSPTLLTGSPGGSRIIDYVAKTLLYTLNGELSLSEAIASPHVVHLGYVLELEEDRTPRPVIEQLERWGHEIRMAPQTSGLNGVVIEQGALHGSVDPRREGLAIGE